MSFGMAYATKKRGKKSEKGVHQSIADDGDRAQAGTSKAGFMTAMGKDSAAHEAYHTGAKKEHERVLGEMRSMPKPALPMAEGGSVEDDADMIARIMHKRKEYAQGGVVANDVGVAEADELPAEFDDLVLDDHLEGEQPKDSNEKGDADVSDDPIDRLMMKRKKDKLPRPA